ncbi:DUF47 domain-containing protein [Janibacter sp. GXQ6167]|uniref:DUF47 domain-containing protein n=1 Tax=Janibacter sp. GXQ6167 TaxID=3240791 RepID=UPI0035264BE0
MGLRLTRPDHRYDDLLTGIARHAVTASRVLTTLFAAPPSERDGIVRELTEIERAADALTHELIARAARAFVTPIDHRDLVSLARALDRCVNTLEGAGDMLVRYHLSDPLPGTTEQLEVIARMADLTAQAMPQLRKPQALREYWESVSRLENQADMHYRRLLALLLGGRITDPIAVMRHRDVLERLEAAANSFEEVALLVELIAVTEA